MKRGIMVLMPLSLLLFPYDDLYKRFKGLFLYGRTFIRFLCFSGLERTEKGIKQKESNVKTSLSEKT